MPLILPSIRACWTQTSQRLFFWMLVAVAAATVHPTLARASCSAPGNAIEAENCLPGTSSSVWQVAGSGDPSIQGFATDMSVDVGQTIRFKIDTDAAAYTVTIFRLGYYGGLGARQIATVTPSATLPQIQPPCLSDAATNLVDCGNWAVSASWAVPSTAVSGVYLALLERADTGGASQIVFVVRNDASHSDVVFQTADASWQAYNDYGGHSLYGPTGAFDLTNRAYKVSYNRPFTTLDLESESWIFYDEAPMIHWLEKNGYDVTYISSVDAARAGALITNHKMYLSAGHNEYVSGPERASLEAARAAGVNLAFFTGNGFFWKTRWETSIDGSGTPYRTLVCYKETLGPTSNPGATAAVDPQDPPTWTGTWRDASKSPPADGGRPENALTGQLFRVNGPGADNINLSIEIPAAEGKLRFWRNTQIAAQSAGQVWTLPAGSLGYEWDTEEDNGYRPAGLFDLSTATYTLTNDYLLDAGGTYGAGTATHHMSLYRAPSGALVFGAGTVQWSWGLDADHTNGAQTGFAPDINMQQATVNLFADMGVQPVSLDSGLMRASKSTDTIPPTSTITSPNAGFTAHEGSALTVSGTAADSGGGIVAGVEVSLDGGVTWHPAIGTISWSYSGVPAVSGTATIESRAVDDSGNIETPGPGVTVTVATPQCPCTVFGAQQPVIPTASDGTSYELGMKFQSDRHGEITAIRYWKAPAETGTHTGRIWTASGQLLATVTFAGESSSGWQQQALPAPLTIQGNTPYVVSVNVNQYYVATDEGLAAAVINGDLGTIADGANGVFGSVAAFPTQSYQSSNYFRDIAFTPTQGTPALVKVGGDGQSGTPGYALANPMVVKVLDANDFPVAGATVAFSVVAGGGSISPLTALTDSRGEASAVATLGAGAGIDTFVATVTGYGSLQFSATAQQDTVFTSQVPADPNVTDGYGYELGMKFRSALPGLVTAIRYWKAPSESGTHVGRIWSASGVLLASVPFSGETGSGWQLQALPVSLAIAPNTTYVVSVGVNAYYVGTGNALATSVANGPLSSVADGANGVYGSPAAFPSAAYHNTNYFRDVSFLPSTVVLKTAGDNQSASLGTTLPTPLQITVMNASGVVMPGQAVAFTVTAGGGTLSSANAVTDGNGQASVQWTVGPSAGVNTVHVSVAGIGAADFAATGQPYTVFSAETPIMPNLSDGVEYELGMKFKSTVPGQIAAIRFWKAPSETGPHTGNIWAADGTLLATVMFSNETGSGWQVQPLGSPLVIQSNTTYVVSVNVNSYYVATNSGLATSIGTGPIVSVADGADGVFGGPALFPTSSYENSNYFRDVEFVPQ